MMRSLNHGIKISPKLMSLCREIGIPMAKVCIVNAGVNMSHGALRSPILTDRRFELITIPDDSLASCEKAVRYQDLPTHIGIGIPSFIRKKDLRRPTHYDPEFETNTYGDVPGKNPRASNLKKLSPNDAILFYARLVSWSNGAFTGKGGFYIVGYLIIEKIYRDISKRPQATAFRRICKNAHVIRAECNQGKYDGFWVFAGSDKSRLLKYAIPFDRRFIEMCDIRDSKNKPLKWTHFNTELSAIGSYFRSTRIIKNKEQIEHLWKRID